MTPFILHRDDERALGTRNYYSRWERLIRAANMVHTRLRQLELREPIVHRRSPALQARIDQLHAWRRWCILERQRIPAQQSAHLARWQEYDPSRGWAVGSRD